MHLLFDLDGTLADSRQGIVRCIQHALNCLGRSSPAATELTRFVGPPLAASFATLLRTTDDALIEQAIAAYRERFEPVGMFENALYPGVRDALADFAAAGHDMCVVTGKPHRYARQILEHLALSELFSAVYGPGLRDRQHTKESLIRHACAASGPAATRAIMIGDRAEDILGAKANGLRSVGVTWGYSEPSELERAQPDYVVGSIDQLVEVIRSAASQGSRPASPVQR